VHERHVVVDRLRHHGILTPAPIRLRRALITRINS